MNESIDDRPSLLKLQHPVYLVYGGEGEGEGKEEDEDDAFRQNQLRSVDTVQKLLTQRSQRSEHFPCSEHFLYRHHHSRS